MHDQFSERVDCRHVEGRQPADAADVDREVKAVAIRGFNQRAQRRRVDRPVDQFDEFFVLQPLDLRLARTWCPEDLPYDWTGGGKAWWPAVECCPSFMGTPSVYISSTFEDLKEYRAAVFEALDKAGFRVGRMEGYAASDERPLDVCLQDVESRDIYVGIFAWRYGYIPPKEHGNVAGLSITECEYRHALAKNKPTLCFFHDPEVQAGELALFPEDVPTPEQVLCELWGRSEFAVKEKTLRPLHNLSVVTWYPRERAVRLHNSVRAALRTWVADGRASHRRLLDAWRDPMQLSHEYAWRWYGWHCLEAADPDRLRKLLLAPTWLKAKLEHTEVGALVADCERLVPEQQTARRGLEVVGPKPAESGGPDPTIRLLGDALRNSSHVLARAPSQLCDQLFGRLRPGMSPELDKLCDQLLRDPGRATTHCGCGTWKRAISLASRSSATSRQSMARCSCQPENGCSPGRSTKRCGCGIWRQGSKLASHLSDTNPA